MHVSCRFPVGCLLRWVLACCCTLTDWREIRSAQLRLLNLLTQGAQTGQKHLLQQMLQALLASASSADLLVEVLNVLREVGALQPGLVL